MKTKNMWTAVLSGAVLTTLAANLPYLNLLNFLCCASFWGSTIFAIWLYRHLNGELTLAESVRLGALTGLCAGVLGFCISFLGWAGFQGFSNELARVLPPEDLKDFENVPAWGILVFNLAGVVFTFVMGLIGGWIGGTILRTDRKTVKGE